MRNKILYILKNKTFIPIFNIAFITLFAISYITSEASNLFVVNEKENVEYNIQLDTVLDLSKLPEEIETVATLDSQINYLYEAISKEIGIGVEFIRIIHELSGGKALYLSMNPNIFSETTIETLTPPVQIKLGKKIKIQEAPFIETNSTNENIRKSEYYLPDALYSVCKEIDSIFTQRKNRDRKQYTNYFNSLTDETQQKVEFLESVLEYTGEEEDVIDKIYPAYQKIVDLNLNDELAITEILKQINIEDETRLNYALHLINSNEYEYCNTILPYEIEYTSRENMFIAATSLVGRVRYVWGGGHSGTAYIKGINPAWEEYNELYLTSEEGFSNCLKQSGGWCPIHGYTEAEFHGEAINTVEEYIKLREDYFSNINEEAYEEYMSQLDDVYLADGTWKNSKLDIHTLDGLDCSGYVSWVYTQIIQGNAAVSSASNFVSSNNFYEIQLGKELKPGDVFAWRKHIVLIVGKSSENSKAYVTLEATTNTVKFGIIYYEGTKQSDISYAYKIAAEANKLIGNIDDELEPLHSYCMDRVKYYTDEEPVEPITYEDANEENVENTANVETRTVTKEFAAIGRYNRGFLDENTLIDDKDQTLYDSYAIDVIQHTLNKMPITYVLGYNEYDGELFDTSKIGLNIGIDRIIEDD